MNNIEQHIAEYIENKKPPYNYLATYRENIGALHSPKILDINVEQALSQKVIFISDRPNYHFLRVSKALMEKGRETILLTRWGVPEEQNSFFTSIILYDKFADLKAISPAQNCQFFVQTWVGWNFLHAYISSLTKQPIYCNVNDLSNLLLKDIKYFDLINLPHLEAKADLAFELMMLENAQLVTMPYTSEALEKLPIKNNKLGKNIVTFPTYPLSQFSSKQTRKLSEKPRLLYTAMIPFDDRPDIVFSDAKLQKPVKTILKQGLSLTIFNNPQHTKALDNKMLKEKYRYFYDLMNEFSNFTFKDGFMPWHLKEQVANFDFGTVLHSATEELVINPTHYERILPSKLFTYIEAGLPIIVVDNFKSVSQLVIEHNLGIVISENELPHLNETIRKRADEYPKFIENLIKYRANFNMKAMSELFD
ncbi:hypothetical protein DXX93_05335 [Thalassotalea euphylliae]|uniref:Glucosyltransferase 3-like C-terminal domain-containing protein n=1 Tax=Thalassotalea euphylliae TaxID=1655234 RepID=A0A3E0TP31_9GAMM|nr:hypothetical protein [Thalassotalea euphylliae]REL26050.1 hypothetical protein DXX93_05335 [Thalassotalea euphylliae]